MIDVRKLLDKENENIRWLVDMCFALADGLDKGEPTEDCANCFAHKYFGAERKDVSERMRKGALDLTKLLITHRITECELKLRTESDKDARALLAAITGDPYIDDLEGEEMDKILAAIKESGVKEKIAAVLQETAEEARNDRQTAG